MANRTPPTSPGFRPIEVTPPKAPAGFKPLEVTPAQPPAAPAEDARPAARTATAKKPAAPAEKKEG